MVPRKKNSFFAKSSLSRDGISSSFDFLITPTENASERLVKAVTNPKVEAAKNVAFSWIEVQDCRPVNTKMFAIISDALQIDPAVESVFNCYGITPIPWSSREDFAEALKA